MKLDEAANPDESEQIGDTTSFRGLFARESHSLVTIPIIQRDFAQGRDDESEIRDLFLDSIVDALMNDQALDLDFIYGSIEGEDTKSFCPLDGQQRLTTLFLLHWYLAWANDRFEDFQAFVSEETKSRFTYAVRPSSGEFFDELVRWVPSVLPEDVTSLRNLIEDQSWFYRWWTRDPTIQSCLTMLDAIHSRIDNPTGLYDRLVDLENPLITFQLLDLKDFGLTDDLYIKMNARGKPLTSFEVFKARLETRIEELLPDANRELDGDKVTTRKYFSQKIDREWAEFFWKCRAKRSRLFDNEVMNLVGAVALVTRDPSDATFEETLDSLRDFSRPSSYHLFASLGCLDVSHIDSVIDLLDFVAAAGRYKSYLPESTYYDEERVFRGILNEGRRTSYPLLIQFFAYIRYLQRHGADCDADKFFDWMRVIVNLTENSNIERPEQFKSSLSSIAKLLDQSSDILGFIAGDSSYISPFSRQQIREERIKSRLIIKGNAWNEAVLAAEQHGYFDGQIEFLLDFSGILASWKEQPDLDWDEETEEAYFEAFESYREKASQLFEGSKSKVWGEFRTERALLTFGDYLLSKGQNSSFLEDADSPISWKRLLRGEQYESPGSKRGFFKELLDNIDLDKGVKESLDEVISNNKANKTWRQLLVDDPRLIGYCLKRKIRFLHERNIYLLRRERRSTDHADLFSYSLFLIAIKPLVEAGKIAPFTSTNYNFAKSDTYEPSFTVSATNPRVALTIWNYGDTYCIRCSANDFVDECKTHLSTINGFTVDSDGDFRVEAQAILEAIRRIADALKG